MRAKPELKMSVASCVVKSCGDSARKERYLRQNLYPPPKNCCATVAVIIVSESKPGTDGVEASTVPGNVILSSDHRLSDYWIIGLLDYRIMDRRNGFGRAKPRRA